MQFQCDQCKSILISRAVTDGMRVTCPVCNAETVCHPYGAGSRPCGVAADDDGADANENPARVIYAKMASAIGIKKLKGFRLSDLFSKVFSKHSKTEVARRRPFCANGEVVLNPEASKIKHAGRSMGLASRKLKPANGKYNSRILKPVKKKSNIVVWGGVLLLLLAAGAAVLCLLPESEFKKYRNAAEDGDVQAMWHLAKCYEYGKGVKKDYEKAIEWYRQAADGGSSAAMRSLAINYKGGRCGLEKDNRKAINWLRKAADAGDNYASFTLGDLYARGDGVDKDMTEAVKYWSSAAYGGHLDAMCNLGICYTRGWGTKQDGGEAVMWLKWAAEKGHRSSQNNLACWYMLMQNVAKAMYWWQKAAEQGDSNAMLHLAECYFDGFGIARNVHEGAMWLERSARNNNPLAMQRLGKCYMSGIGVRQDINEANRWFEAAAIYSKVPEYKVPEYELIKSFW